MKSFLCLILICCCAFQIGQVKENQHVHAKNSFFKLQNETSLQTDNLNIKSLETASGGNFVYSTSASSMIVMEVESGLVVASRNDDSKRKMASTTKIMTAITIIESGVDLNKKIKVPKNAVGVEGSSIYLKLGEELNIKDLLYGLMLRSGNDSAVALANEVGGGVENFVKMMNEKAIQIGAKNSHFTNPHGLDHEEHFTTAYDLGLISCYAMRNPVFKEIVSAQTHRVEANEISQARLFVNKNKILRNVKGGVGIKTGFTKKSGRCLVSAVERDGLTFVCVVLNCGPMFEDSEKLLNTAFNEYEKLKLTFDKQIDVEVDNAKELKLFKAEIKGGYNKLVKKAEADKFSFEAQLNEDISAPLKQGDIVGKFFVKYGDKIEATLDIALTENVEMKTISKKPLEEIIKDLTR